MAKMDKDALMKQKFWIALGAYALLFVIGYFTLSFTAAGPIEAKKKEYQDAKKDIESWTSRAKNRETFLPPWESYGKVYRDHKNTIWKQAWEGQKDLLKWPGPEYAQLWNISPNFEEWKKQLADETGGRSSRLRYNYQQETYLNRLFIPLGDQAKTAEPFYSYQLEKDIAPVEFKGGTPGFEMVMAPATGAIAAATPGSGGGPGMPPGLPPAGLGPRPGDESGLGGMGGGRTIKNLWAAIPDVEEIWLAQEDFSVKAELLAVIRRTLDSVAQLKPFNVTLDKDNPLPAGVVKALGFRNSRWEIVIYLENAQGGRIISKKSTIKNVSSRVLLLSNPRTRGPLVFQLKQGDSTYDLRLKGEPLSAGKVNAFNEDFTLDRFDFNQPIEMKQVLDWSTSPIRRIDAVRLGYHSHRTSDQLLIESKHFPPPEPDPAAAEAPVDTGMGMDMPPGPAMPGPGVGLPGGGPGGEAASPLKTTKLNGLVKNRYASVTGQARSLPIAMTLVMDQTHIHDFLVELANCQLRFQITQMQLKHVRDVSSQIQAAPAAGGTGPMLPGQPFPGPGPGREGDQGYPGAPGSGTGLNAGPGFDPNLVEITVYGMTTLYEKFHVPTEDPQNPMMGN